MFEALGDYLDSRDTVSTLRYQEGVAAMDAKDFGKAIESFAIVGAYEDSEQLLEQAIYQWGLAFKASGDTASAIALIKALPDNTTARQLVGDFVFPEAVRLEQAGELQTAAELFLALADRAGVNDYLSATYFALLLGSWEGERGTASFAEDNSYTLVNKAGFFNVDGITLLTGDSPGNIAAAYTIVTLTDTQLSLSPVDDAQTVYDFTRVMPDGVQNDPADTP